MVEQGKLTGAGLASPAPVNLSLFKPHFFFYMPLQESFGMRQQMCWKMWREAFHQGLMQWQLKWLKPLKCYLMPWSFIVVISLPDDKLQIETRPGKHRRMRCSKTSSTVCVLLRCCLATRGTQVILLRIIITLVKILC